MKAESNAPHPVQIATVLQLSGYVSLFAIDQYGRTWRLADATGLNGRDLEWKLLPALPDFRR